MAGRKHNVEPGVKKPGLNQKLEALIKADAMPYNLGLTIGLIVVDVLLVLLVFGINSFSSLSKNIFLIINVVVLVLLLIVNLIVFFFIKNRRVPLFEAGIVMMVILLILGVPGNYMVMRVNSSVNSMINTSGTVTESVETSIVVHGTTITDLNGLNGKLLGIVPDTTYAEKSQEQLSNNDISVTTVEYDSFSTLLLALLGGDVDAAALPKNFDAMYGNEESLADHMDEFHSLLDFETVVESEIVADNEKDLTKEPFSVLILGSAQGLTDSIIVATFNPISLRLTMSSIARDSWVPICGGGSNKINAANNTRGLNCAIQTVEDLLDVDIDYYFMANFRGVVDIVDAIGGIVINNPYEIKNGQTADEQRGHATVWVPAGENVPLNGEQALAFARERHLYASGDFQRQVNQQTVINAILTKCLRIRDLNTMLNVLKAAGDNIDTNISQNQLIELFNYIMQKLGRWKYNDDHPEKVIDIVGSRVTGYNSSIWSESSGLALSIVVPYQGSIEDNHNAIMRNLMIDKTYSSNKYMVFDASYEFVAPKVSNETYSEAIQQSQTPPSYWCEATGGTYSDGACACPVGTQFVSERGCQAVQTDYSTLTSDTACVAAGGKWSWDTNSCSSACQAGYVESTYGYCTVNVCSADNPSGCTSESACTAVGNSWNGTYCTSACNKDNVKGCTSNSACNTAGGLWHNGSCVSECPSGYTANNGTCQATCTTGSNGSCNSQSACNALNGYYDNEGKKCYTDQNQCPGGSASNGLCKPKPTPSTTPTISPTPTVTTKPSATPSPTPSQSTSPTPTATTSPSPTPTATATPTAEPTPTPTPDCTNGKVPDGSGGCVCPSGSVENSSGACVVVKPCGTNAVFNADLNQCVCSDSSMTMDQSGNCSLPVETTDPGTGGEGSETTPPSGENGENPAPESDPPANPAAQTAAVFRNMFDQMRLTISSPLYAKIDMTKTPILCA